MTPDIEPVICDRSVAPLRAMRTKGAIIATPAGPGGPFREEAICVVVQVLAASQRSKSDR